MRGTRAARVAAAMLAVFVLIVSGCTSSATPTGTQPEAAKPKPPQKIVISYAGDVDNLDPHQAKTLASAAISSYIHDRLWEYPEGALEPTPRLATSWQFNPAGTELTIKLRKGVAFQDGTPFDAAAVKFNLDRLAGKDKPVRQSAGMNKAIVETRAVDSETVLVRMEKPFAPLMRILSTPSRGMISPKTFTSLGEDYGAKGVAGTGPFKLKELAKGSQIVLERNKDFWGEAPKLEEITFKFVPEASTRVLMMESGDAMVADKIPPSDVPRLKNATTMGVRTNKSDRIYYLALHTESEDGKPLPFADKRVRQALNYAINRDDVLKLFGGYGQMMDSPYGNTVFGYVPTKTFAYDLQKAKDLLAQAGFPNGFTTSLWSTTGYYPLDKQVTEAIQAQLAEVGVKVNIVPVELATYQDLILAAPGKSRIPREMVLRSFSTQATNDPGMLSLLIKDGWPPKNYNVGFYYNPKVDDLHGQALTTFDTQKRLQLYKEIQQIVMDDAPWLFLYYLDDLTAVSNKLKGVVLLPDLIDVRSASVE